MNQRQGKDTPDYLIIGHITRDLTADGFRLGGTAVYASILAARMGLKTALVTSFSAELDLGIMEGIKIVNQIGKGTTTFNNIYSAIGRTQFIQERAPELNLEQIPAKLREARIVHLAPVAGEVPITAGKFFPRSDLAYSLQGWLRSWDQQGKIQPAGFKHRAEDRPSPGTAFLSIEDLGNQRSGLNQILEHFPEVVLTTGREGAEIYADGRTQKVSTIRVEEIDPTGAGDIFAAGYLVARHIHGKTRLLSARFANTLAGLSLRRPGVDGIPTASEITEAQRNF